MPVTALYILTTLSLILSAIIAIGLLHKKNMWIFICAYWITQFLRYAVTIVNDL